MKNNIQKLVGMILTLVLLLTSVGVSNVSAADNSGKITVTGAQEGKNYSLYKIFDVSQSDDNLSYTIAEDWKVFFTEGAGEGYIVDTNTSDELNPIVVDDQTKYINITEDNIADFAQAANAALQGKSVVAKETAESDTVTFTGLALGYYMVHPEGAASGTDNPNSVISLTLTKPTAEVIVKATYPTVEKTVEEISYDYGEAIEYTLKGTVPDTKGYREYKYTITDTLSDGLTLNTGSVKVYVGEDELTTNVTLTTDANKIVAEFDMMKLQAHVGKEVKITYTASLNENAVIGVEGNPNKVVLEYSNDPHSGTTETTEKTKKVYTGAIKVIKHEEGDVDKLLADAKFKLKKVEDKFYKLVDGKVTWVVEAEADELTTGDDGIVEFKGLENGTYYLVETEAPAGYNKLTSPVEVEVDYKTQTNTKYQEAKVANNSGVELPGTGGIGTTIFSVLGGAIILIALSSLLKGKLKRERN